ncbi:MAG: hypothetical protein QG583_309 [Patescibacteria group bacterium]|nr:hypothetical protein [Patescibacteria group bacterium]
MSPEDNKQESDKEKLKETEPVLEKQESFEDISKSLEREIESNSENFSKQDEKVSSIEQTVNLSNPNSISEVKAKLNLEENLNHLNNQAEELTKRTKQSIEWLKLDDPKFDENSFYRVVDEKGFKDYQDNQIVRSSPTGTDSHVVKNFDIGHRPTSFPSFAKGEPNLSYAKEGEQNYIFESNIPMYRSGEKNPVTEMDIKGRHWAYRPIDQETGEVIKEMTPEMIKDVYKVDKEGNLYIQKKESASLDPKKENYNVELDPLFKEQFEKESYFRLKTYDKKFFDQNYSGISERGYLLDLDGKETASLPSQNIAGKTGDLKYSEFVEIEKQKFFHNHPELLKKHTQTLKKQEEMEKSKIYENPGDDPALRDLSDNVDKMMKYKNSPRASVVYSYLEDFAKKNPEKLQAYLRYGHEQYKNPNAYQPIWYEQLQHVSKMIELESAKKDKEGNENMGEDTRDNLTPEEKFKEYVEDLQLKPEDFQKTILDVGAGDASFAKWAKDHEVSSDIYSLEPSDEIPEGDKNLKGNAEQIPLSDESIDLVVSVAALPNIYLGEKDPEKKVSQSFSEMLRVLKSKGEIRLTRVLMGTKYESQRKLTTAVEKSLKELQEKYNIKVKKIRTPENDTYEYDKKNNKKRILAESFLIILQK